MAKLEGNNFYERYINTPDHSYEYDTQDIQDNKIFAILAYLWILFFLPLVVNGGQSRYGRFHANQGFILFLTSIVLAIAGAILGAIPFLGAVCQAILSLADLALVVLGIYNAATGKVKTLPFVGQLFHVFDK